MTTTELLTQRLEMVLRWYEGMVNARTGFLEYLYLPESDAFVREESPIRDIASLWDTALVASFVKQDNLRSMIERSLAKYCAYLVHHEGSLILDPHRLGEPSSIAHSAFMVLALLHAPPPRKDKEIAALAGGIMRQQRPDGSYKVYFHDLPDSGEELYAGEAMLALLETYRALGEHRLLDSATRAFAYYDERYFRGGRVTDDLLVFSRTGSHRPAGCFSSTPIRPRSPRASRSTCSACRTASSGVASSMLSSVLPTSKSQSRSPARSRD